MLRSQLLMSGFIMSQVIDDTLTCKPTSSPLVTEQQAKPHAILIRKIKPLAKLLKTSLQWKLDPAKISSYIIFITTTSFIPKWDWHHWVPCRLLRYVLYAWTSLKMFQTACYLRLSMSLRNMHISGFNTTVNDPQRSLPHLMSHVLLNFIIVVVL